MGNRKLSSVQKASIMGYEAILAAAGMPAELPPCGDVRIDPQAILGRQLSTFGLLADLLEDHGIDPQDLLTAARNNPEELRVFIDANLPGLLN